MWFVHQATAPIRPKWPAVPLFCGVLLLTPQGMAQAAPPGVADVILYNGKIVTVDPQFSIQQAVAIRGDRILAVGDDRSVLPLKGPTTKVVDLRGKAVIPGLIDDHYHMMSKAVDHYLGVEVALVSSLAEMLKVIGKKAEHTPLGETVYTTSGWLPEQLRERRTPTRYDLDSVSPRNPVVVQGGHTMYLNSLALQRAGISSNTPQPSGGFIEKDAQTGEPTGLLVDNAMYLARKLIPVPTDQQKREAVRLVQKEENSVGITSIREPGINPEDMRVYDELWNRGELTLRVSMNLNLDSRHPAATLVRQLSEWGVTTGFGNSMLRLDGIGEFGIDGGFEAALMSQPYERTGRVKSDKPYFGLQRIPTDYFDEVIEAANRFNWRGCVHAVGDRGVDITLDAYTKANQQQHIARKRWVIEHAHYTRPDQFTRIKELDVTISTQFHPYMAAQTMVDNWGRERAEKAMRVRDWLDAGLRVGGGSDWSLVPANPFWIIYFFVTRDTRLWGVLGSNQKVTREEALRMMTINNAYITFEETEKGSLEAGKLADLVVLSGDILTIPDAKIRDLRALLTVLGGKVVYQQEGSGLAFN